MPNIVCFATLSNILEGGGSKPGLIIAFAFAALMVVLAGIKLSRYGDALGERTGLGSGLVGLIFLAGVTSLPELVVSTTSTIAASIKASGLTLGMLDPRYKDILTGGADLAIGNMIGSNVFNLMLFVVMDLVQGKGALLFRLEKSNILAAASGLMMLGIVLFGFAFSTTEAGIIPGLHTGYITPLLFITYIAVMILQNKMEKKGEDLSAPAEEKKSGDSDEELVKMPAVRFYGTLLAMAAVIVACGMWLSMLGDRMAVTFGLGQSFVGTIFLAVSTSLPELVVSVASVRMGFINMAVGNILGSNIFNMVILFTADIGLRGASLLHYASQSHLVTIAMVMMLTCTAIMGMTYRSEKSFAKLGFDVWVMLGIYLAGNTALYLLR